MIPLSLNQPKGSRTERGILFSAEMVRALLADRKSQTRRIIKPRPGLDRADEWELNLRKLKAFAAEGGANVVVIPNKDSPYGKAGDHLWVREAWRTSESLDHLNATEMAAKAIDANYREPWAPLFYEADKAWTNWDASVWGPGLGRARMARFMPRWASRITLEITEVRVQRVREISEGDAQAEGVIATTFKPTNHPGWRAFPDSKFTCSDARGAYRELWDSINGEGSWESNPWVWAISFRRVDPVSLASTKQEQEKA